MPPTLPDPPITVLDARFETSAADPGGWPALDPTSPLPEIAFVGRSNVGKSSLLNALAERKGLARTSSDPGRTRLVNFFLVDVRDREGARRSLRFVDLPGFGYAKVSKTERSTWRPAIERYLGARSSLAGVVLLVDARRVREGAADDPDALLDERELARWIAARGVHVIAVMTKVDKLAKHERSPVAARLARALGGAPITASAVTLEGRDRLLARIVAAAREPTAPTRTA